MHRNFIAVLVVLGLIPMPNAGATDLLELYALARANDPVYQAAVFRNEADRYELPLAEAAFKPSVTTRLQLGRQNSDGSGTRQTTDNHSFNLNFNLPLYDRTQRTQIGQAQKRDVISGLRLREADQDLILRTARRYFSVLAATDTLEVARREKIAIQRQMDLTEKRLEVGLGTPTDLFDARARFKQAEADELRARNRIDNERALLKQIIGVTPGALRSLREDTLLTPPNPNDIDTWIELSEDGNIGYRIGQLNHDIAHSEITRQQNARSAVLGIDGNYNYTDSGPSRPGAGDTSESTSVAVQLRFPLYLGGTIDLRTAQAGRLYNQIERQLEEARRVAATDTTSAFLNINSQLSEVEALFDAITAGESALHAKEEGFAAGLTTNLDVLDAQRDLSRSRTNYLQARYNYILSVLELEAAVGDLDDADIQRVNSWLE